MKLNVNSPRYVLVFAALVSTVFTAGIMTLHAVSESTATASAQLYEQKSLVEVFKLGAGEQLSDRKIGDLYERSIRQLDMALVDSQTGKVFNNPGPSAGPLAPRAFVATNPSGTIIGYALPVSGIGFWSRIDGYLAVTPDFSKVIGIVFTRHQETPGLGGRITEPKWRKQFAGLDITPPGAGRPSVYIGGDKPASDNSPAHGRYVDAITGATGTSSAVNRFLNRDIDAVRRAAEEAGLIGKKKQKQQDLLQSSQRTRRGERDIANRGLPANRRQALNLGH